MLNIAVLVSGGGTNLQAMLDAKARGEIPNGRFACVVASNPKAYALERAKNAGVETEVLVRKEFSTQDAYDDALLGLLERHNIDLVVLAGFMTILSERVANAYAYRMINVHPALIPSFCGQGYYGLRVHEAALEYGVKVTGATVHFVNEVADGGAIILQKAVKVQNGDTPEILQKRVMEQAEWKFCPEAVSLFCDGKIKIQAGKAVVIEWFCGKTRQGPFRILQDESANQSKLPLHPFDLALSAPMNFCQQACGTNPGSGQLWENGW